MSKDNKSNMNIGLNKKNTPNANNSNISRTNIDTQFIDLNSDGDSDESKYNDDI